MIITIGATEKVVAKTIEPDNTKKVKFWMINVEEHICIALAKKRRRQRNVMTITFDGS